MKVVQAAHLTKIFRIYEKPLNRLKERLIGGCYHREHHALKDVSFTTSKGETLGVLGRNGAGKSTLLKLLTGVLKPDSGELYFAGKVTGLLELGSGFDFNLSGESNIETNGLLIGMTQDEIREKKEAIIAFSELGEYIEEPVRTYSSGMTMRLAFSIAIHADPDCFVIDEALSVGDAHFQQKCFKRIKEFKKNGGSILFVSHDLNAVKMLCDRVIVLEGGVIVYDGSAEDGVNTYNRIIAGMGDDPYSLEHQSDDYGSGKGLIICATCAGELSESSTISAGEILSVVLGISVSHEIEQLSIGMMIRDRFGQDIFGTNSHLLGLGIADLQPGNYEAEFSLPINLAPGKYTITFALHSAENHLEDCYHWSDNLLKFEVAGSVLPGFSGVAFLPTTCQFNERK